MNNSSIPSGLVNALTTPFNKQGGIDFGALEEHLNWLQQANIDAILVGGTTGEFFSLGDDERLSLLTFCRTHFKGHLMFHGGAAGITQAKRLCEQGQDLGADSIAALLPFYLASATHNGLVNYLTSLCASCTVPFVIYNFPKHTQVGLTGAILDEVPHAAIKDSAADFSLIKHTPHYLVGSDLKMRSAFEKGAKGFVSARSNAHPTLYARLSGALLKKNMDQVTVLHQEMVTVAKTLSGPNQIQMVKETIAASLPGYPTLVRPPL